jgi:DNA repair protein RadA/Sms
MVLAVLEARAGVSLAGMDVYLNVAGGLRVSEPAADLAVAAALLSALTDTPLPADAVVFGEISLSGAIRPVSQAEARLKEALKLGFASAWAPSGAAAPGMTVTAVETLGALTEGLFGGAPRRDRTA